ncbi:MAG TPA: hypothetical protein VJR89_10815, partial [Polyangiales bacterium]|nr:hypothetical protein [Polyangiales bacterium]
DDHGRIVHVQRLTDVPPRLRPFARRMDEEGPSVVDLLGARLTRGAAAPAVYRYRAADGRLRYTNVRELVPAAQRTAAEVDLSRVSLNSELGRDLNARLEEEHLRLVEQPVCQQLTAAADRALWEVAWRDHGPLVVCGGVILLLVFVTPWMVRKVGGPEWSRTMGMAVPVLAAFGVFAYVTIKSNAALSHVRESAAPCTQEGWAASDGLVERMKLLQGLRVQQAGLAAIAAEGR